MTSSHSENPSLAILSIPSSETFPGREVACAYRGMQGKRLIIESNEVVSVYTAVTLRHEDTLYLGDVMSCTTLAGGQLIEIRVAHILSGLQSLLGLRAQLLSGSLSSPRSLVAAAVEN